MVYHGQNPETKDIPNLKETADEQIYGNACDV
jgi:hypothetical protein